MVSHSREFAASDMFSLHPLFKLNDERVVGLGVSGVAGLIFSGRLCAVWHVMMA